MIFVEDPNRPPCEISQRGLEQVTKSGVCYGTGELLWAFPPPVVVEILLLMLCQLASVFPGKVVLFGPNPIQQHLFSDIDNMRDGKVRLVNALLRTHIGVDIWD